MATVASRYTGVAEFPAAGMLVNESQAIQESEARGNAFAQPIIEISDKDYRSFCFPCHALEEMTDCNAGY